MNLIIKSRSDNYFKKKLGKDAFTKEDYLCCWEKDEVSKDFDQEKVFSLCGENKFSTIKKLIGTAWRREVNCILFVSDNPPASLTKIALGILSVVCFTSYKIDISGICEHYTLLNVAADFMRLIFSPAISLLLVPKFFLKEVLYNFILPRENRDRRFIAVGKNNRLFGVIYWYALVKKAKMHGLFGYAFNDYMGVAVSLFHFPLSLFFMSKLGFRTTYLVGFLILFMGVFNVYYAATFLSIIAILFVAFLLMMSNIIWEHASLGVYEILAWGFGMLGLVVFIYGNGFFSGILLGLSVLSHLGSATLLCLFLFVYSILHGSFLNLVITGTVAFSITCYWFVPFFLERKRLTRMRMINEEWEYKYRFGPLRLVQFCTYFVFTVSLYLLSKNTALAALAMFPLLIAYINAKVKWLYSPYTVRMFQAAVGIFCLSQAFNVHSLILLLYFLYLPPKLLSWHNHDDEFYYCLSLSACDDLLNKTEELFGCLEKGDRVGFELGSKKRGRNLLYEHVSAFFSYFLLDRDFEVFNTPMTELVKFDLYRKTCSNFNPAASFDELQDAVTKSGLTSLVAFSEPFKKMLEQNGFKRRKTVKFSYSFSSTISDIEGSVYGVPTLNERITPKGDIQVGRNCLRLRFPSQGDYKLKYSYDPGLVCKQGERNLILKDDGQGMIFVKDAEPGEALIRYSYNRLFLPWKRR